jgi:class 3 adenylate cyclase/tetratricopeptide (TPR) repeat protein
VECQTCGRENRSDARFCDACGARLHASSGSSAERRQLTALFCDIVDYTPMAARLDEELLHRVIGAYQQTITEVIERWGGRVDFYAGDGVNAYFGYPLAHENDTERAVSAALDIMPALSSAIEHSADVSRVLATVVVRIGIHTGPVVVGELGTSGHGRKQPLGSTLNVAARLQAFAPPGTVVISAATEKLVAGMFLTEDLGVPVLKGVAEAFHAFLVRRKARTRGISASTRGRTTRLVGRDRELAALLQTWDQARSGHSQVLLISGEAGIGKTRLVRSFVKTIAGRGDASAFEWRCSPFHTSTPFHPIIENLEQQLGLERGRASRAEIAPKIAALLTANGVSTSDALDVREASLVISEMVASDAYESEQVAPETPVVRRARTLHVLREVAHALARSRPTAIVVEDLHWADASTLELLGMIAAQSQDVALVLALTFRPEFASPWAGGHVHSITLEPLSLEEGAQLVDALVGDGMLPPPRRSELLARADGVPLFIEELTRTMLERPHEGVDEVVPSVPNPLRGLLASRIDRLSAASRETIHLASALSRQFRFDLIAAVSDKSAERLRDDLDELAQLGLVTRNQALPSETYSFKHALIAEAAYESIVRSDRRRLHSQIAHRLRDRFPEMAGEQPELLARHFEEAGETETAIEEWRRAGETAIRKGAYEEAISHFDRGLKLLNELSPQRRLHQEIELTASKGTALFSRLGYAHPDVERIFARASALCEQDGSSPTFWVLYGVWAVHLTRSNRPALEALLPRFEELARSGDGVAVWTAHANAGVLAFFDGNFTGCLERMTTAIQCYSGSDNTAAQESRGYGGGMYLFAYQLWSLAMLGRLREAAAAERALQEHAAASRNPYGLAIADGYRVAFARDRRDPQRTFELADRQVDYTRRQMLPFWEGPAHCARGWARAHLGEIDEGIAEIRLGLHYLDAVGLRATYAYQLSALVEALLLADDAAQALAEVGRGLAMCRTDLDCFYGAEFLRLEAECHARLGNLEAAEAGLTAALALARSQSARLFALRSAESLSRLRMRQGMPELARQEFDVVLAEISKSISAEDLMAMRHMTTPSFA